MTLRDFTLEGLEQSLNRILALDPEARQRLSGLHGRVIRIDLLGTGFLLNFVPGHDGRLQIIGGTEIVPDCTLSGSPIDLMRASNRTSGHAKLFAGRVQIEGNTGVAQRFSEALARIDIDWEEQLAKLVGDIAGHEIARGARSLGHTGERLGNSARENLSEYLTEEARLLPHRFEVEDFLEDVDRVRDAVDRIAARIALLEQRKAGEQR